MCSSRSAYFRARYSICCLNHYNCTLSFRIYPFIYAHIYCESFLATACYLIATQRKNRFMIRQSILKCLQLKCYTLFHNVSTFFLSFFSGTAVDIINKRISAIYSLYRSIWISRRNRQVLFMTAVWTVF